jgi:hypothetical protein
MGISRSDRVRHGGLDMHRKGDVLRWRVGELFAARQVRSICRIIGGYTSRCRNGLTAAMYADPSRPFGFTSTAICPR